MHIMVQDILKCPSQAIVNAANPELVHGGGIAKVIAQAAGIGWERECSDYVKTCRASPDGKCSLQDVKFFLDSFGTVFLRCFQTIVIQRFPLGCALALAKRNL